MWDDTKLDKNLESLLEKVYYYFEINPKVLNHPFKCSHCIKDEFDSCIRFSQNKCFYDKSLDQLYNKLEDKLQAWLKENEANQEKIQWLKNKSVKVFSEFKSKWLNDSEFQDTFQFFYVESFENNPIFDENGDISSYEEIEVKVPEPYRHYEFFKLYQSYKEKCLKYANKIENSINI